MEDMLDQPESRLEKWDLIQNIDQHPIIQKKLGRVLHLYSPGKGCRGAWHTMTGASGLGPSAAASPH